LKARDSDLIETYRSGHYRILFLWLSRGLFLVAVIFHEESFELLFIYYLALCIDGFFAGCLPLSLADFEVFRDRACHCSKV
ncbi:MAG: hypothetical protein J7D61_16645, partial [Marichromatium sp.]|nr:hypothetical protein [Marichromatium sp.]